MLTAENLEPISDSIKIKTADIHILSGRCETSILLLLAIFRAASGLPLSEAANKMENGLAYKTFFKTDFDVMSPEAHQARSMLLESRKLHKMLEMILLTVFIQGIVKSENCILVQRIRKDGRVLNKGITLATLDQAILMIEAEASLFEGHMAIVSDHLAAYARQ